MKTITKIQHGYVKGQVISINGKEYEVTKVTNSTNIIIGNSLWFKFRRFIRKITKWYWDR